jgi:hypothetical protein
VLPPRDTEGFRSLIWPAVIAAVDKDGKRESGCKFSDLVWFGPQREMEVGPVEISAGGFDPLQVQLVKLLTCPHKVHTYMCKVTQCVSPRRNYDLPHPLSRKSVCTPPPPTGIKGGGAHSSAVEGVGESQFRRLEKKLSTLITNCAVGQCVNYHKLFTSAGVICCPYHRPSLAL